MIDKDKKVVVVVCNVCGREQRIHFAPPVMKVTFDRVLNMKCSNCGGKDFSTREEMEVITK